MESNNYVLGEDDSLEQQSQLIAGTGATRSHVHTDNTIEVKYYDKPKAFMDKIVGLSSAYRLDLTLYLENPVEFKTRREPE
jgi:hypothetical protein